MKNDFFGVSRLSEIFHLCILRLGLCTVQLHMFLKINMAFFVVCSIDCHYLVLFFRQAVFLDQWWRRFSFVSKRQLAALLSSGKLGVPGKQERS